MIILVRISLFLEILTIFDLATNFIHAENSSTDDLIEFDE